MYTQVNFKGNTLLREKVHGMAHHELGVKVDGAFYSRAYKAGVWDGITDFYDMKEDKFHTGLLQHFLAGIRKLQEKDPSITYELDDIRPPQLVHPDSLDNPIVLLNGEADPITLIKGDYERGYQYESVQQVFREQVGIVNVATNGGKTEIASAIMQQVLPYLKNGERIAFFTHSKEIFHQSADRVGKRLGLQEKDIGKIGDGKFDIDNKKIVFVMVPTLISALKDPKKGVKFTAKEQIVKFIAENIAPKFQNTVNTRQLLRNYIKNCTLTTKVWKSAEEQLMYIAYDNKFTDKSAQMQLRKYMAEFDKIMEKKNKTKYNKYKQTMEFMDSVKVMIGDEIHHAKSDTWYTSLSMCGNAVIRVGLTGTVDKKDKMGWQRLQALFNQITIKVSNEYLIERGISSKPTIRLVPIQEPRDLELVGNYQEAYKRGIVENDVRNEMVSKLAVAYKKQRPGGILISVREIDHGNRILELLRAEGLDADFIHGGSDDTHRTGMLDKFSKGQLDILLASTIIDEGVDVKSIGCMILAAGGKSMRQLLQRIGRGLRLNGIDGNTVIVFDFYDQTNKYLLDHSHERLKVYKEEKFNVKQFGE